VDLIKVFGKPFRGVRLACLMQHAIVVRRKPLAAGAMIFSRQATRDA
jgi:hypothetical protein